MLTVTFLDGKETFKKLKALGKIVSEQTLSLDYLV